MARGDHIFVFRSSPIPFQHHGVDMGDGTVVHFTDGEDGVANPTGDFSRFVVQRTQWDVFVGSDRPKVNAQSHRQRLSADDACERAMGRVGEAGYDLLHHNCEHLASWCVAGIAESRQVSIAVERGSSLGLKAFAACGVQVAARMGIRSAVRRVSPLLVIADAAQFLTESCGQYVGIKDPQQRQLAGRIVGGTTAVAVGAAGGPAMVVAHGAIWAASEVAGEASRKVFRRVSDGRRDNGHRDNGLAGRD